MTVLDVFSKTTMVVSALNLFVSIPIYIFVIVTIAVNKKKYPFNSPFFTIFIALGIMDIACFVDYLGAKTPFWGFFPSLFQPYEAPSMLAKVNNFFIWFTGFAQYYLIILIAANRYIALCWPLKYHRIFVEPYTMSMICVCIAVPFCYCIPILCTDLTYSTFNLTLQGETFKFAAGPQFKNPYYSTMYYNVWQAETGLLMISSAIMYALMIITLYKHRKDRKNDGHKTEMKLFYAGLCLFATCILYVAYFFARVYLLKAYATDPNVIMYRELSRCSLFILADMFSLNNHFVILYLSPDLRKQCIALLKGPNGTSTVNTLVASGSSKRASMDVRRMSHRLT